MYNIKSKIKTAKSLIKRPSKMLLPAGQNGMLKFIPDKKYLKAVFKAELGYPLDLDHPQTYNEKLQWLKLYDRRPEYIIFADKYRVRDYISRKIGEKYLIPLIGVYKQISEIPWEELPNQFVLKCNHDSGTNIICRNKEELNIPLAKKKLYSWLRRNAFWGGREWCYKDIEPCIICEEYIGTEDGMPPDDYKIMCFNGIPKLIQVHHDRYGNHTLDFMDTDWKKTGIIQGPMNSLSDIPRPDALDEMLELARLLSKDMFYARIDFYLVDNKVKFGEITMYPTSGFGMFDDLETDIELGKWIKLPIDKK